jgi:hypothetical protein
VRANTLWVEKNKSNFKAGLLMWWSKKNKERRKEEKTIA